MTYQRIWQHSWPIIRYSPYLKMDAARFFTLLYLNFSLYNSALSPRCIIFWYTLHTFRDRVCHTLHQVSQQMVLFNIPSLLYGTEFSINVGTKGKKCLCNNAMKAHDGLVCSSSQSCLYTFMVICYVRSYQHTVSSNTDQFIVMKDMCNHLM